MILIFKDRGAAWAYMQAILRGQRDLIAEAAKPVTPLEVTFKDVKKQDNGRKEKN